MAAPRADDLPVTVWWPPRFSTVPIGPRQFLRIEVDDRLPASAAGAVFATPAEAEAATAPQITRLAVPSPDDDATVVTLEFPGGASHRFAVRRRASRVVPRPILVSSRKPFDVVPLGDGLFVGVRRTDVADVDASLARVYDGEALAAADRDSAVIIPEAAGSYDAAVTSPDQATLIAFEVIVADEIERSAVHEGTRVAAQLPGREPLELDDDIGLVPARIHEVD